MRAGKDPFTDLKAVAGLMRAFDRPWAFCGGWAIDLFLDRKTRDHQDVDVALFRQDQLAAQAFLMAAGWGLEKAHDGRLSRWNVGEFIEPPLHTIWCKNSGFRPDFFEVLFNEAEGDWFRFRRKPAVTLELAKAVQQTEDGLPFLAPEIVLLYKSNNPDHAGNAADFEAVLPALERRGVVWLRQALNALDPGHAWIARLQ